MENAPQHLTVILSGSSAPRIWTGHIEDDGIEAYLGGLDLAHVDHVVSFHHMEVFADVGNTVKSRTYIKGPDGWVEVKE